jgi:ketosteroid isomerase-like protein
LLRTCLVLLAVLLAPAAGSLGEPSPAATRAAVERALPLVQRSAAEYTRQQRCFSCHHQAVALLALNLARAHGFTVDGELVSAQLAFTAASLRAGSEGYRQGRGQGGQVDTAGYALLALESGGWKPDETTAAVAEYLLQRDASLGHWRASARRPPSEQSEFTATYLALRALDAFATPAQKERVDARRAAAREWLLAAPARDTEDLVFRLWALHQLAAPEAATATRELLAAQRDDGGWSQAASLESDAYATGSALVALHQAGRLAAGDPAYRRGLAYLVTTQQPDGSWRVVTRSQPIQAYFETGFPYGKDQFISMAASCWAIAAIALAGS